VCCSVLQCVAVCCSALQCVAACCSVLQCVAVCCSVLQCVAVCVAVRVAVCCNVLQCVAAFGADGFILGLLESVLTECQRNILIYHLHIYIYIGGLRNSV